jgi:hypothetical protein
MSSTRIPKRLQRSSSQAVSLRQERPKFPDNFAEILIKKEMQLDSNCVMQVVTELVELYGQAVEHYHGLGNSLHIDYQDRM